MSKRPSRSSQKINDRKSSAIEPSPAAPGSAPARERAFLVGLEVRTRPRGASGPKPKTGPLTAAAQASRDNSAGLAAAKAPNIPEFSAEESLDELRSLAVSAGAEIVGEFLQHRDRPDPATLIGRGKLEEIAAATASV